MCCQGGMDPPRAKEGCLLRRISYADYLHVFNESSPGTVRPHRKLLSLTHAATSLTSSHAFLPHSTRVLAVGAHFLITSLRSVSVWLCLWWECVCVCVFVISPNSAVIITPGEPGHVIETEGVYRDLDLQLHLLWLYVKRWDQHWSLGVE